MLDHTSNVPLYFHNELFFYLFEMPVARHRSWFRISINSVIVAETLKNQFKNHVLAFDISDLFKSNWKRNVYNHVFEFGLFEGADDRRCRHRRLRGHEEVQASRCYHQPKPDPRGLKHGAVQAHRRQGYCLWQGGMYQIPMLYYCLTFSVCSFKAIIDRTP